MNSATVMERFGEGRLLFDGGMGSMLIPQGLAAGWPPEEWNVSRPEAVVGVHRAYLQAGAEVVETNTFGGTRGRLAAHGFSDRVADFNREGVRVARQAIATNRQQNGDQRRRFVAFSMGPGAEMLPPVGTAEPNRMRSEFLEQLRGLGSGDELPDLILIETMIDVREALVALEVAKATIELPVAVSLTYNRNRRGFFTVMGDEATAATRQLEAAGADVIAANCSISSRDMLDLAVVLRDATTRPLLCQPNAGSPGLRDGIPVYEQSPEEFAEHAVALLDAGVNAVGGCCGTTPEFIGLVADAMEPGWRDSGA